MGTVVGAILQGVLESGARVVQQPTQAWPGVAFIETVAPAGMQLSWMLIPQESLEVTGADWGAAAWGTLTEGPDSLLMMGCGEDVGPAGWQ